MRIYRWGSLIVGLSLLLSVRVAVAQSTFAGIVGTVQDSTGAFVAQSLVTLRNTEENISQTKSTNESGEFLFLNLKPGKYEVKAEKAGFSRTLATGIQIDARQERRVSLRLSVESVGQTVEVTEAVTTINTENATIADTKDGQQVIGLPVNYRGATTSPLAALVAVPGVQQDSGGALSIGGGLPSTIEFSLDGISTANVRNTGANVNMYPSSELIGELRVSAVNNNAEFAQVGDVTVTTKSGSNLIHGSLFEYLQNRALDATTYGALIKPAKVNNTFGASFGGPIVIPHLLDGHDRTFFFADFEGNRLRGDTLQQYLVPTADERAGDLSAFGQIIVNPVTQLPYTNSKIPQVSSVATKVLQYYPLPNTDSTSANYVANVPTPASTNGYDVRVDHVINQRSQIFGRWSWKALSSTGWNSASGTSNSTLLPSSQIEEHNRSLIISHSYTIRPSLLNEFRFGLSLWKNAETFPLKGVAVDTALGLTGMDLSAHPEAGAFPAFNFIDGTGFTPIGRQKDGPTESSTYQFTDNVSWSKGHHTLKAGVDYRRLAYQDVEHFDPGSADDFGSFTFYSNAFSGNAFADFLLGLPYDNQVTITGPNLDSRAQHWGVYGQDEYRLTSRLTVSFGLRWELHAPFTEQKGNITNFDPATGNVIVPDHTLAASPAFLASINACPGTNSALPCSSLVSASTVGLGPGLRKTYFGNFDPRLGIAFRPFSDLKTVFRAGIGIFTASNLGPQSFLLSGIHTADFVDYINYTGPGIAPLFQLPQATYTSSTAGAANGNAAFEVAVNTRLRDAESAQWNVTVEREFPGASTVRLSYIGMNTYRLQNMVDLNQVRPSSIAYDSSRKPYQNWGQVFYSDNNAGANYQAFQAQVDHPYMRGLYLQGSYTWAKSLTNAEGTAPTGFPGAYGGSYTDRFNERGDRGNDYGTRRHRFLLTGIYQLPMGKGHSLLPDAHGITQTVLGGWKLSTITLLQTGPYQTPTISASLDQANINAAGNGASVRPDRIGNGNISKHTPNQWYDINAFQAVPDGAGRDGNSGVGILEGPGTIAVAAGLAKEFSYQEKVKVRFEASFTNLLNHPNFAPPGVNVSNPSTFGVTNSVQTAENAGNRAGQLALRVEF